MKYDVHDHHDILKFEGPVPSSHPRMSKEKRASQFAPFAALTGYEDSLSEESRITEERILLEEEEKERLNFVLQTLDIHKKEHPRIRILYFLKDEKKSGGSYVTLDESYFGYDETDRSIILSKRRKLAVDDIRKVEILDQDIESEIQ